MFQLLTDFPMKKKRSDDARHIEGWQSKNERIECLNTGGKAMRPRCDEHLLPPGITFRCEPATLAPGAKGDLVIGFDPAQATRRPPVQLPLILEGPDVPPSGRTLQIRFEETE